jgi:hypothetical protein
MGIWRGPIGTVFLEIRLSMVLWAMAVASFSVAVVCRDGGRWGALTCPRSGGAIRVRGEGLS